ncbi:MAG: PucR family transcriptional regulator [Spirochaetales bacterium]|nr:PucR family transcriptional regulator [Spirochaetales bacterium]
MGFTVEDALRLQSLKNARVVAGRSGMKNSVYGVTVFDYKGSEELQAKFFSNDDRRLCNEIVITSFAGMESDEDLQCKYIRHFANMGEAALVIYYTGIVLRRIPVSLVAAADELSFPLILMPEGRIDLRYGDFISELSSAVLSDRMHYNGSLVTEIIGQVSRLPSDKQTIDSVLKLLSGKLHVSVILTDNSLSELGEAQWPAGSSRLVDLLSEENVSHHVKRRKVFAPVPGSYIWYVPIHDRGVEPMRLFLIEQGTVLDEIMVEMAKQAVQLAVELWSNRHSAVLTSELVKAIINDEPIRMRRLSEVLNIDIRSIHTTWVIRCTDGRSTFTPEMIDSVRNTMNSLDSDIILEPYRSPLGTADDLIMFFRNPLDSKLLESCGKSIIANLHRLGCKNVYLTMLDYKATTAHVRKAFAIWNETEAIARAVFPNLEIFHESEIELVRQCNEVIKLGEASISAATGCLDGLEERHGSEEFIKTLEVYYLDADMNMQTASEMLGVHKNTIKYRINMVCDALGHSVSNPVTTSRLTMALAIRRLLERAAN